MKQLNDVEQLTTEPIKSTFLTEREQFSRLDGLDRLLLCCFSKFVVSLTPSVENMKLKQ